MQEPRQKILDIETAVQMLSIAMPPSEPHLAPFISFLQTQKEYKAINLDQWTSFQRFAEEVFFPFIDCMVSNRTGMHDHIGGPLLLESVHTWAPQHVDMWIVYVQLFNVLHQKKRLL